MSGLPVHSALCLGFQLALALLCLFAATASSQGCDCDNLALTPAPVCADGLTFVNRCVAECQGAKVVAEGPCASGVAAATAQALPAPTILLDYANPERVDAAASVDAATLNRFSGDGYRFSAKVLMKRDMQLQPEANRTAKIAARKEKSPIVGPYVVAARLDKKGDLYLKMVPTAVEGELGDDTVFISPPSGPPSNRASIVGVEGERGGDRQEQTGDDDLDEPALPSRAEAQPVGPGVRGDGGSGGSADVAVGPGSGSAGGSGRKMLSARGRALGSLWAGQAGGRASGGGSSGSGSGDGSSHDSRISSGGWQRRRALVIGADSRVEVEHPEEYPFSAVGFFSFSTREGDHGCSAALIGNRTLLTAGHCVWDSNSQQFHDIYDMAFYPDKYRGNPSRPVYVDHVLTMFVNAQGAVTCDDGSDGCHDQQEYLFDFAVVTLEEDLGEEFGYLGYGGVCDRSRVEVTTAGYPGDLPKGNDDWPNRMYMTTGTLDPYDACADLNDVYSNYISSDLDTASGQSGSAIWDDQYVVRAIHVAGLDGEKGDHRSITKWVFDIIQAEANTNYTAAAEAPAEV